MESCAPVVRREASTFYLEAMARLESAGIPFLVGGAYAFSAYSKVVRETKDFDLFLLPGDVPRARSAFEAARYETELPFPHWLAKVHCGDLFIDLIFSSGNGVARVDALWFEHAVRAEILDRTAWLCPAEELIWSKAYVQERERFDGADVAHLLRALGPTLDWARILLRFGDHWRVLLAHIVLFGFVYPDARDRIPSWVLSELLLRLGAERPEPASRVCYGTLLSREQYLVDLDHDGYEDARVTPRGQMTSGETEVWRDAIQRR